MKTIKKYKIIELFVMFVGITIFKLFSEISSELYLPYLIGVMSGYIVFVLAKPTVEPNQKKYNDSKESLN